MMSMLRYVTLSSRPGRRGCNIFLQICESPKNCWCILQVWRHQIGAEQGEDALIYHEEDEQFYVHIGRSRDDKMIFISSGMSFSGICLSAFAATGAIDLLFSATIYCMSIYLNFNVFLIILGVDKTWTCGFSVYQASRCKSGIIFKMIL